MSREIAKKWMESEKDNYLCVCLDVEDAIQHLVDDTPDTDLDGSELDEIAREVLATELANGA